MSLLEQPRDHAAVAAPAVAPIGGGGEPPRASRRAPSPDRHLASSFPTPAPTPLAQNIDENIRADSHDGFVEVVAAAVLGSVDADPGSRSGDPAGEGGGVHDGSGEHFGDGAGLVGGQRSRRRPLELFGRVIGGGVPAGAPVAGERPFISLKESAALRTHDLFPRLPAAAWTERRPYMVMIDLCVSEQGNVTETTLLSNQSPRFDALVLNAVRGWRYRTRLVDGQPRPFCHEVVIRYDIP